MDINVRSAAPHETLDANDVSIVFSEGNQTRVVVIASDTARALRNQLTAHLNTADDTVAPIIDMEAYQQRAATTAIYRERTEGIEGLLYATLGLTGEAGEIANKVKKIIRDQGSYVTEQNYDDIAAELGDVLWYVAMVAAEIDYGLDEVAHMNLTKLARRAEKGTLTGSGDNR